MISVQTFDEPLEFIGRNAAELALPRRRVDNVRIWLIFTQAGFLRSSDSSSRTRGNPARGDWLVNAIAMTVPECSLNTSALRTTTGRRPACSWPTTGLRLA